MPANLIIRPLRPDEWRAFRDLRLAALKDSPGLFASSYEDSAARAEEAWRKTLTTPGQCVFGVFDGDALIGLTAVFPWAEDPSGETAITTMGYLLPAWRGRGLSHMFHTATVGWLHSQPQFKLSIVGHRASNQASGAGIRAAGYVETERVSRDWPDGTTEDEVLYALDLR